MKTSYSEIVSRVSRENGFIGRFAKSVMSMKIEIVSEKENPFLGRKELIVKVSHEAEPTPTKAALQQIMSKELKVEPTRVEIRGIFSKKGIGQSEAKVKVWKEPKVKDLEKEKKESDEKKEQTKEKVTEKKEESEKEQSGKEKKSEPKEMTKPGEPEIKEQEKQEPKTEKDDKKE